MKYRFNARWKEKNMDFEEYCKMLEQDLNIKNEELEEKDNKISELKSLINNANEKMEEYYLQQKDNVYFSEDGRRLILRVIENCQAIVNGNFGK